MIFPSPRNIALCMDNHKIKTRPNAGQGLWLMFLLPLALIVSTAAHPIISTSIYKLSSIFSVGIILSSLIFLNDTSKNKRLNCLNIRLFVACFATAALFHICLHRGPWFSFWSAAVSTIIYYKLYLVVLKKLPKCFTLGEASICSQSYVLLLYSATLNIFKTVFKPTTSVMQMSTLTIQIGLIGISTIIIFVYKFNLKSPLQFYLLAASVMVFIVVLPLQILLRTNPLSWILNLFWEDLQRNKVILFWIFFSTVAVLVVNRRVKKAKKANTATRKIFHFLTLAVFVPGLLYNCSLLYLASGVVLGIFFMLEVLRVLNIPPLAEGLQNGFVVFSDEKDIGIIAFTPMYLLAGCALPLWVHPAPCDVTNSAIFNLLPLLSGLLCTGIGDTAASIVGLKYGTHHWKGSNKTVEGTLAYVASQLLVIFLFAHLGLLKLLSSMEYVRIFSAIIITSIIEAKTDQVDNLILPFVMYMILIV